MKKLFLFLLLGITFSSCSKDSDEPTEPTLPETLYNKVWERVSYASIEEDWTLCTYNSGCLREQIYISFLADGEFEFWDGNSDDERQKGIYEWEGNSYTRFSTYSVSYQDLEVQNMEILDLTESILVLGKYGEYDGEEQVIVSRETFQLYN